MKRIKSENGCECYINIINGKHYIDYCSKHRAAPELLEALKDVASFLYGYSGNSENVSAKWYVRFKKLYTKAFAIIAKAESTS